MNNPLRLIVALWLVSVRLVSVPAIAQHGDHDPSGHASHADHAGHSAHPPAEAPLAEPFELGEIPDTQLVDQRGEPVLFRSQLLADQLVAINFIFTTCTTICPPQGAIFSRLRRELEDQPGPRPRLVSVSIDPATDTPERLAEWSSRFGETEDWTLLTGTKLDVDNLLKKLGVFSALKEDHAPIVLLGNAATNEWIRAYGLAPPDRLADLLVDLRQPVAEPNAAEARATAAAREYFTDLELVAQDGQARKFYSDLIQDRTVVINSFFADCTGSCPMMHSTMAKIQEMVGPRLGEDVFMLSITVDPENDTPEKLGLYARRFSAKPGWYFLTGDRENVEGILGKLGQRVQQRESHKSILLVGNDRTGLWKKAFALAPAPEILTVVRSVVEDEG